MSGRDIGDTAGNFVLAMVGLVDGLFYLAGCLLLTLVILILVIVGLIGYIVWG